MNSSITNSITKERDDAKAQLANYVKAVFQKDALIDKLVKERDAAVNELAAIRKHFQDLINQSITTQPLDVVETLTKPEDMGAFVDETEKETTTSL
jgi:hypothetical protein